jgi:Domain of unknown function (DUF5606)
MEYSKIISVVGLPGLYELINTKSDGAIVRSLDDKSTRFASSRIHNFSHLESIEVYTTRENVNLAEIFQAMEKAGGSLPDTRDNGAVKKYFEKVYPDIDFERVYSSDLKKMIKWYEGLKKNEIEIKLSEPEPEEEVAVIEETEVAKEAPTSSKKAEAKQKPAQKKPAKKKAEEKPVKSKKESPKKEKPAKKTAQKKKK